MKWAWAKIDHGLSRRIKSLKSLLGLPRKIWRLPGCRRIQRASFARENYGERGALVIFLFPGMQRVTGGGLQIFSLHRLTRKFLRATDGDSVICWLPGTNWSDHRFEGFDNDVTIFPLEMVLRLCREDCELLIHLPEFAAESFCHKFGWTRIAFLRKRHKLKISILEQNNEVMPNPLFLKNLRNIVPDLNATVGSSAWMTRSERQRLGIPLHLLPTWYYPDDAPWQPWESKEDLLIVSPDASPCRDMVINAIRRARPELRIQIIWGLKYEDYLKLERAAKWSLTFGEGLDGYFYGPMLRGGISFAVRNGTFDIPGLEERRTIYDSYEDMAARIVNDMRALDDKSAYETYTKSVRIALESEFGSERTANALHAFYRGNLTMP
ncbi:MAG TPA: hypothetical protein PKD38_15165 [Nitrospira sp.]|nr:hypothetical protein [Nitrospira sp.]